MTAGTQETAQLGRDLVAGELRERGFAVRETSEGRQVSLLAERGGVDYRVRVSAKRSGTWQTSTGYGAKSAGPELRGQTWVFVDVGKAEPRFFVVPHGWMSEDIYAAHQEYLARHGGTRVQTPSSTHHAVRAARIAQWRDRWDVLLGSDAP